MSMRINFTNSVPLGVSNGVNKTPQNIPQYVNNALPTVKGKDGEEYVVENGHPKTIYKKNPQTGKLEYVTQVYDGSWGRESSDEDLIRVLTTKVK